MFAEFRTGLCKNNVHVHNVFMDNITAVYFHEFLFLVKLVKINHSQKKRFTVHYINMLFLQI